MDSTVLSDRPHNRQTKGFEHISLQDDAGLVLDDRLKVIHPKALARRIAFTLGIAVVFLLTVVSVGSKWATIPREHAGIISEDVISLEREIATTEVLRSHTFMPHVLNLGAKNEYGECDHHALALYGLDLVVEPYRETILHVGGSNETASFHWSLIPIRRNGSPIDDAEPVIDAVGGHHATVELKEAGQVYALRVKQLGVDGTVMALGRATVSCKYIRRELRALTVEDRTAFFQAMQIIYTTSSKEGIQKYGRGFINYADLTAHHNALEFCFHNGMQFLTSHTAFNVALERSLQMVNPRVSLASWDFMIDSARLGADWPSSEIFSPNMFGSAFGDPEKSFQISDGWFANISTIYDPNDTVAPSWLNVDHSAYGYISAKINYQDLPVVTRTHSYCGMKGHASFATCETFIGCYEENENLNDWEQCMETETDMEKFLDAHPGYSRGLLTFVLEFVTANLWPGDRMLSGLNTCDTACTRGQTDPCGCTCDIDVDALGDDEVYGYLEQALAVLTQRYSSDIYIDQDASMTKSIGFKQDGVRLSEQMNAELRRLMLKVACEPGAIGAMSGGASPSDPIFWVLHPIYEKALHALLLAPRFRNSYDFTWVDNECTGSGLFDEVPFTEKLLGFGSATEMLSNVHLAKLLNPDGGKATYIYDSFQQWGTCDDWDPCPDCHDRSFRPMV